MPNYAYTTITMDKYTYQNVKAKMDAFNQFSHKEPRDFDFNAFIPMPGTLVDTKSPTDYALISYAFGRARLRHTRPELNYLHKQMREHYRPTFHDEIISTAIETLLLDRPEDETKEELDKSYAQLLETYTVKSAVKDQGVNPHRYINELADNLIANLKIYGLTNWYDWACIYWGTKWNAIDDDVTIYDDDNIEITFTTAWDTPRPLLDYMSRACGPFEGEVEYEDDNVVHFETGGDHPVHVIFDD